MAYISKVAIGNSTYNLKGYPTLIPCAYCNTAAATAAKTAVCTDYTLTSKTYLHVLIKTANSSAGKITLNVNGKGAKDIWINGAVSSASNYTLPAGSYITYYDGSKYLFRTDGKLVTSDLIANSVTGVKGNAESSYRTGDINLTPANIGALALTGGVVTGNVTIRKDLVKGDTDAPALLQLQARYTPTGGSQVNSTASLRAYSDHGAGSGANLVIHPGGNLFIGSGEAPNAHYNLYPNSGSEITFITADSDVNIQANGQTIANRKGLKITTGGEIVPNVADVATNDTGSIGTSKYNWANIYATNLNGVAIGNNPKFTDANVTQSDASTTGWRNLALVKNDKTSYTEDVKKNMGLTMQVQTVGVANKEGIINFAIGNSKAKTVDDNYTGRLYMYNGNGARDIIQTNSSQTGNITLTLPNATGTFALTSALNWKIGNASGTTVCPALNEVHITFESSELNMNLVFNSPVNTLGSSSSSSPYILYFNSNSYVKFRLWKDGSNIKGDIDEYVVNGGPPSPYLMPDVYYR